MCPDRVIVETERGEEAKKGFPHMRPGPRHRKNPNDKESSTKGRRNQDLRLGKARVQARERSLEFGWAPLENGPLTLNPLGEEGQTEKISPLRGRLILSLIIDNIKFK